MPTQVVEPGLTTDLTWNTSGQLTQLKQTDTTTQSVPFSTSGRTRIWAYTYGTGGNLTSVDGPLAGTGDTTSYAYNAGGNLTTVTDQVGHVSTATAWNGRGQPTSVKDPNNTVTQYAYDPLGRLTSITVEPTNQPHVWTVTYTAAGDVATLAEPSGRVLTYTWDNARRLTAVQNNAGERLEFSRDAMGNITGRTAKAPDGTTILYSDTNTFDELGRLIHQAGGTGKTWSFAYDKTDNLTGVTDPLSKSLSTATMR